MPAIKPNAETYRVRALSYLVAKNLSLAQLEIQKAIELEPNRESVHVTAAIIDYFNALTTIALPSRVVQWPAPVDWNMVKRDDESLFRLRGAAKMFRKLSNDKTKDEEARRIFEAWLLACLANDPDRQEEAAKYSQGILQSDPAHFRAIAWIAARNYAADLKPSEKALSKIIKDKRADIPIILALVSVYFSTKKGTKAAKLLEQTKHIFQDQKASTSWIFWYSQALVLKGEAEQAVAEIDKAGLETELRHARTIALRAIALKSKTWGKLIDHLEASYKDTGDPTFLIELCDIKAQQKEWNYIADRAEDLVQKVNTTEILRLATISAFNAKRYDLCLHLLDAHRNVYSGQKLPNELRKIRIFCHRSLGSIHGAISEAEELARDVPTTENIMNRASLYAEIGDISNLSTVARQLVGQPDITPEQAIWLGRLVLVEDRDLAVTLWKKAISLDLPDALVGEAMSLGYQLGRDDDLSPLMARMAELGRQGRGGIQMASVHDLVDITKRRRERDEKLGEFYKQGAGPIHIIAKQVNQPLVELYHGLLLQNEEAPDPAKQFRLLARHGGRNLVQGFPNRKPEWRLNIDVTSLLLGEHLEILDKVMQAFKPLRIMGDLMPLLLQMRDRIIPHQPSRLQIYQQIVEFADAKAFEIADYQLPLNYENVQLINEMGNEWVAILEKARASKGYFVDFLPLHKRDLTGEPTALPPDTVKHIITCRSIVEALRTQGPLSDEEYRDALRRLGDEGRKEVGSIIPKEGHPLYLCKNTPEVLAEAKVLSIVCERFKVYIELSEIQRVRAELKEDKRRKDISEWMTHLIEKINKGITSGDYEIVHLQPAKDTETNKEFSGDLENRNLFMLMGFTTQDSDVIWVDDRYLNSYVSRDKARIIDISEILKVLASAGTLGKKEYYGKIQQLRRANVRFIPIQQDEITYQLNQAVIENEKLVETQALKDLKRYIAACLMQNDILQRPPMPEGAPNKTGEIAFVIGLGRAIVDALLGIWTNIDEDKVTRIARAEWLIDNLYLDHLALRNIISVPQSDQEDRYIVGLSLAGLLSQAISITTNNEDKETSLRKEYFGWLYHHVLKKRFDVDSSLLVATVDNLKKLLIGIRDKTTEKDHEQIVLYVLQRYYEDLPEIMRDELMRDTDFMANIGFRPQPTISIEDLRFVPDEFWKAVSEAVNGRVSKITSIESKIDVIVEPAPKGKARGAFKFMHPVSGKEKIVQREELELLIDSPSIREATLRRNRNWFDCPGEIFNQIIAEIVSLEDAGKRIEKVEFWQNSSAAYYYEDLKKKIMRRRQFSLQDLLPPSAEGLLRHFRFTNDIGAGKGFRTALTAAAQTLIDEEGLLPAIDRLIGFPTPIPTALIEPILKLEPKDRDNLVHKLLKTPGSPLSRIHLVKLLLQVSADQPKYTRLARKILQRLISAGGIKELDAFVALLKWVNEEFGYWSVVRNLPPHIRLALVWTHTHRVYSYFEASNAAVEWIKDMFTHADRRIPYEIFERSPDYWFDIAHPRLANHVNILIAGLSYSIGNEASRFIDEGLSRLVSEIVFQSFEGVRVPTLPLLRYAATANNSLDSFLGGDYGDKLTSLIKAPEASIIEEASLKESVEQAIQALSVDKYSTPLWAQLYAILGDMPLYDGIGSRINELIIQTDMASLFEKDVQCGFFAIQLAAQQVLKTKDDKLRDYMKVQIVKVALHYANKNNKDKSADSTGDEKLSIPDNIGSYLLDVALNISIGEQSLDRVMTEFVNVLTKLVNTWRPMVDVSKPVVQRLCEELPVSQAKHFWPLLIRLRAE